MVNNLDTKRWWFFFSVSCFFGLFSHIHEAFADLIDDDAGVEQALPSPNVSAGSSQPVTQKPTSIPGQAQSTGATEQRPAPRPNNGTLAPKGTKDPKKKKGKSDAKLPVYFESNGARAQQKQGLLELEQNVVVTQGTMRMEADAAQIFYDEAQKDVAKVIAKGNVKLFKIDEDSGEKIQALGDIVTFLNKERLATMEGNARLWRGADLVRGKKITYEMDSGWIRADRVTGEVHPGSNNSPNTKPMPAITQPNAENKSGDQK